MTGLLGIQVFFLGVFGQVTRNPYIDAAWLYPSVPSSCRTLDNSQPLS